MTSIVHRRRTKNAHMLTRRKDYLSLTWRLLVLKQRQPGMSEMLRYSGHIFLCYGINNYHHGKTGRCCIREQSKKNMEVADSSLGSSNEAEFDRMVQLVLAPLEQHDMKMEDECFIREECTIHFVQ
eukprot:scaffold248369_cov101-Cyclotella_meneghiniana.AAC.1